MEDRGMKVLNSTHETSEVQTVLTLKKGTFSFSRNGVDRLVHTGALCFPYWKISKLLIYYNFSPSTTS